MTKGQESGQRLPDDAGSMPVGTWRRRIEQAASVALLGLVYWTSVRPRMLNWGATPAEVARSLPGDDLLPDAGAESTMAITVDASPDATWLWLCQLGQEQGGFYSYEWAENLVGLDIHNADRIVPEWQDLAVGETTTRLLVRSRIRLPENPVVRAVSLAALDPVSSLMTYGMLQGIRRRAERLARTGRGNVGRALGVDAGPLHQRNEWIIPR
jgi:hypothetical protein